MLNFLFKTKSLRKCKTFPISNGIKFNAGMTYVELIVVLSIFSIMSSIVLFNYGKFQEKVDMKNYASDIALKIVQAQKTAIAGQLTTAGSFTTAPAYGININFFNSVTGFTYFADLNNNNLFDDNYACPSGECLEKIAMNKHYAFATMDLIGGVSCPNINTTLDIVFKRPDAGAIFTVDGNPVVCSPDHADIDIYLPGSSTPHAHILVYPSGRVQVK